MGTPTKLGKYALDATPLGQGAMGVVYKGFDPDLGQAVAIKVIRRELVDGPGGEQMRQRFKNEAIAGRRLRHPNIVPVYEYGEDDDCSYIVMAFVEGRPLKDVLDTGPRSSISEALAITGRLLDALQHAHRNNVVHRDIKPANILVGEDGQLQIADFGIAKIDLATLTRTGAILGTPAYMSPEQCLGTPSDHRADIFAAGVILYELLTGEQPFRANAALAVMHQVLSVEPVSPSKLNLNVSAALDAVRGEGHGQAPRGAVSVGPGFRRGSQGGGQATACPRRRHSVDADHHGHGVRDPGSGAAQDPAQDPFGDGAEDTAQQRVGSQEEVARH